MLVRCSIESGLTFLSGSQPSTREFQSEDMVRLLNFIVLTFRGLSISNRIFSFMHVKSRCTHFLIFYRSERPSVSFFVRVLVMYSTDGYFKDHARSSVLNMANTRILNQTRTTCLQERQENAFPPMYSS